jgi:DNA-3-methyladenine glycosylase
MDAPLGQQFYEQSAQDLAPALLGTIMARRIDGVLRRARIVETEAYLGPLDLASHASKGKTLRTQTMFGPAGRAYVYFIYGMHWMFNVVCGKEGEAHAVLLRAAQPLDDWPATLTGPARLAKAFSITAADNARPITNGDIHFLPDPAYRPRIKKTARIGVDYARHWSKRLLRFIDTANPVSARLKM